MPSAAKAHAAEVTEMATTEMHAATEMSAPTEMTEMAAASEMRSASAVATASAMGPGVSSRRQHDRKHADDNPDCEAGHAQPPRRECLEFATPRVDRNV
jgi:hypothetical protein